MTTENQAAELVFAAVAAAWATYSSGAPLFLDNESWADDGASTFARCVIRTGQSTQVSMGPIGNRRFDRNAKAFIQVFRPQGEGTKNLDAAARAIMVALEGLRLGPPAVWMGEATATEMGAERKWAGKLVTVDMKYEEVK